MELITAGSLRVGETCKLFESVYRTLGNNKYLFLSTLELLLHVIYAFVCARSDVNQSILFHHYQINQCTFVNSASLHSLHYFVFVYNYKGVVLNTFTDNSRTSAPLLKRSIGHVNQNKQNTRFNETYCDACLIPRFSSSFRTTCGCQNYQNIKFHILPIQTVVRRF